MRRGRSVGWWRSPCLSPGGSAGQFHPGIPVTNGLPGTGRLVAFGHCHCELIKPIAVTLVYVVKESPIQIHLDEEGHRTDRDQSQQNLGNQNFGEDLDGDSTLRACFTRVR